MESMLMLSQFGFGGDGGILQFLYFIMFFAFIFLYPKLIVKQAIWKLEKEVENLEAMTSESVTKVSKGMVENPNKELVEDINSFIDFVVAPPIDLDPQGLVGKLDKTFKEQFDTFRYFVEQHSDVDDVTEKRNIEAALINTTGQHQITKIVRHFLGLIKKYQNPQIAMLIQMQMPMIKEMADAVARSVDNLVNGEPVGDGFGPLVAANLIGGVKYEEIGDTEMVYAERKVGNRDAIIVKADGPGAAIGYPGDALVKLIKKHKPARIISIDASGKLEGEETGKVAEGVGFAMNPHLGGPQRYEIEEVAAEMDIPLDAVICKMASEEAMFTMKKEIYDAVPETITRIERKVKRIPKKKKVLIVGVGNTCGIGNNSYELEETEKKLKKGFKKLKEREREEEEDKPFWKQ